jgi:predicted O-methyltransferase YrrM
MAFRFIIDYLRHYLTSNSRHGTHSPFVYKLTDEVIYDFKFRNEYAAVENQRKKLLNDGSEIEVTDLGAGSQLNKNRIKKIRHIAKNALKSPRLAQLIYRLAAYHQPRQIIELGTCLGITTAYLSKACPSASITTIEGCPATALVATGNFRQLQSEPQGLPSANIVLKTGNFDVLLPEVLAATGQLDFIYVDGNHRKEATLNYFNWCLPKVHEGSLMIFDDIYWSPGMKEAWTEIKAHPEVTVTVDLFWIGLVYFRKGQLKQDFKIRF